MKVVNTSKPRADAEHILKRIRARKPDSVEGLPKPTKNTDATDTMYPTQHQEPVDNGWNPLSMISGSGHGREL